MSLSPTIEQGVSHESKKAPAWIKSVTTAILSWAKSSSHKEVLAQPPSLSEVTDNELLRMPPGVMSLRAQEELRRRISSKLAESGVDTSSDVQEETSPNSRSGYISPSNNGVDLPKRSVDDPLSVEPRDDMKISVSRNFGRPY